MFSVIIPTLQRSAMLRPLLDELRASELVQQILLVNNSGRPLDVDLPDVDVIDPGHNIFVNPAWNLGASLATQPRLAILNDDLVLPRAVLPVVADRLDRGAGLIGLHKNVYRDGGEFRPRTESAYIRRMGFGCAMFLDTHSYVPIPEEMLIWCGDDWLFRQQRRRNYVLTGVSLGEDRSVSSGSPEFHDLKWRDYEIFHERFARNHYQRRHPFGYAAERVTAALRHRLGLPAWGDR